MPVPTINLTEAIENRPVGSFQLRVYLICFLAVLIDGFDTQIIGFSAKAISEARHIPVSSFGSIFSIGLLGAMSGAFALGPLADLYGRRPTLLAAMLIFAVATIFLPVASSYGEIALCRLIGGFGLGGAIPNLIALASEYTPTRHRGTVSGVLYSAYPLGGVLGAVSSTMILPTLGWEMLFYIGGLFPLILAVAVLTGLPESLRFLARRGKYSAVAAIAANMRVIDRGDPISVDLEEDRLEGSPIRHLFSGRRGRLTAMLWLSFFVCYGVIIILVLWTPALLSSGGASPGEAATVSGMVNFGGVLGTILGGQVIDRFGPQPALPILFLLGAFCVAPIGVLAPILPIAAALSALSGILLGSVSTALLALAVSLYPVEIRASGLGWGVGAARMGQVVAPLSVTGLLNLGLSVELIFAWTSLPALCGAAAAVLLRTRSIPMSERRLTQ